MVGVVEVISIGTCEAVRGWVGAFAADAAEGEGCAGSAGGRGEVVSDDAC